MIDDDAHGVHDYVADPRNADILISVNGELKKRDEAVVSVFDSGYILGDGVWEGLRVMDGGVAFLPEHLKRLWAGAKTIDMDIGLTKDELTARIMDCLKANGMEDGVHIRLMVTRGIKKTPYQGPRFTITKPTIVIIPEYKTPVPEIVNTGVTLFTVHVRRTGPAEQEISPVNVLGVDGRHDEWRGPLADPFVIFWHQSHRLIGALETRREAEGALEDRDQRGFLGNRLHSRGQAGSSATRECSSHRTDAAFDARRWLAELCFGFFLKHQHAEIERDRVET